MSMILGFLATRLGQAVVGLAGIVALWAAFALHYEHKGAAKVIAKVEASASRNADKADAARAAVSRLPDSKLKDRYFRD